MSDPVRGNPGSWQQLALWEPDGSIDLGATRAQLPADDLNAADFMRTMAWPEQLFYVPGDKQWYVWSGRHLQPDVSLKAARCVDLIARWYERLITEVRRQLTAELIAADPSLAASQDALRVKMSEAWKPWEAAAGYAKGLRGRGAAQLLARLTARCGVAPEELAERWPNLANCASGVVNLTPAEGEPEWYRHDPRMRMTYLIEAAWSPDGAEAPLAKCPGFTRLMMRACGLGCEGWDQDAAGQVFWHLLKVLGYSVLGDNRLQLIYFLSGDTNSGKSKLLECVSTVLGPELAYPAKAALFESDSPHSRHEVSLKRKRLVTLDESDEKLKMDENQVKRLTGQSQYTVGMLYDKTMTVIPVSWLIIIANNHMPTITHLDAALLRRLWVIPMGPTILPQDRDPVLVPKIIAAERDGIWALLVWACREAMRDGGLGLLAPPAAIVGRTDEYRREQDTIGRWMADCTWAANGSSPAVSGTDAHQSYFEWCGRTDIEGLSRNAFHGEMRSRPGVQRQGDANHIWYKGFTLR